MILKIYTIWSAGSNTHLCALLSLCRNTNFICLRHFESSTTAEICNKKQVFENSFCLTLLLASYANYDSHLRNMGESNTYTFVPIQSPVDHTYLHTRKTTRCLIDISQPIVRSIAVILSVLAIVLEKRLLPIFVD